MNRESSNELATGAGSAVNINGDVYLVSQPTAADFVALRRWARRRIKGPLREAIEAVRDADRETKEIVLSAALQRQDTGALNAEAINDELATPDGTAFLLWLLARRHHPGTTPATFRVHLSEENVDVVLADLLDATGLADLDPNARTGEAG